MNVESGLKVTLTSAEKIGIGNFFQDEKGDVYLRCKLSNQMPSMEIGAVCLDGKKVIGEIALKSTPCIGFPQETKCHLYTGNCLNT
jgi:hypothetical protein